MSEITTKMLESFKDSLEILIEGGKAFNQHICRYNIKLWTRISQNIQEMHMAHGTQHTPYSMSKHEE